MKIIHTSDLHLNSPLGAHLSPAKTRERRAELLDSLRRLADEATKIGAELLIICGDLFDSDSLPLTLAERVIGVIESHPDVQFLYLPGNHERNVLAECGLKLPENLKLFDTGWCYYNYGQVTVAARRDVRADMFSTLRLDPAGTNVVMLHGAVTGSGADAFDLRYARGLGIDYLALGHYHSYTQIPIDQRGIAVYCGTPEGRGFDECGQKGYVLIEVDNGRLRHSLIPFSKRTVQHIKVDVSNAAERADVASHLALQLTALPQEDIVRAELVGRRRPGLSIDTQYLERIWAERFFYFELRDSSERRILPADLINDRSLRGEFIRLCTEKEPEGAFRDMIIEIGLAALSGEHTEGSR